MGEQQPGTFNRKAFIAAVKKAYRIVSTVEQPDATASTLAIFV